MQRIDTSLSYSTVALITGIGLLIMAVTAFFAVDSVTQVETLLDQAKGAEAAPFLRRGLLAWMIILIDDVLVAWGLWVLLRPVDAGLSLLTAWFRLIYVVFLGIGMAVLVQALLLTETTAAEALSQADLAWLVQSFQEIWSMGLFVFGVHLLGLGYLCLRSGVVPKGISILILLAALGYGIVTGGHLASAGFAAYESTIEMIFMLPMIAGELGLAIWFILRHKRLATIWPAPSPQSVSESDSKIPA